MNQKEIREIRKYVRQTLVVVLAVVLFAVGTVDIVEASTGGTCYKAPSVTVDGLLYKGLLDCRIFAYNAPGWVQTLSEGYNVEIVPIGKINNKGEDDSRRKIEIYKDGKVVGTGVVGTGADYTYYLKVGGVKVPLIKVQLVSTQMNMTKSATCFTRTCVRFTQVSENGVVVG